MAAVVMVVVFLHLTEDVVATFTKAELVFHRPFSASA
jgi:hypothetical protein